MKIKRTLSIVVAMFVFGCTTGDNSYNAKEAVVLDTGYTAKVIKTADMRFRVSNVLSAKTSITSKITAYGGAITESSIESTIQDSEQIKYSIDSVKEIISYAVQGTIIAKIPSERLDDFTSAIAQIALFVDNQGIKLDDQGVRYLENKLKANSRKKALEGAAVDNKDGGNIRNAIDINDEYIAQKLQNRVIDDQVRYSTITLVFYQERSIKTFVVGNDNLSDHRPSFFRRLGLNIADGWSVFVEVVLWLSRLWMLFAMAGLSFWLIRRYTRRRNLSDHKDKSSVI